MEIEFDDKTVLGIVSTLLVASMLIVSAPIALGAQPPVDYTTFYVGTIGQPRRVTGWRAYDSLSMELISNVYETLIFFDRDLTKTPQQQGLTDKFIPRLAEVLPTKEIITISLTNTTFVNQTDPASSEWTNGTTTYHLKYYIDNNKAPPAGLNQSDVVYLEDLVTGEIHPYHVTAATLSDGTVTITVERIVYTFKIRTGVPFHPWKRRDGVTVTTSTLDTADVEYSFEAGLIHDGYGGPQWILWESLFDVMSSDSWGVNGQFGNGTNADWAQLGRIINDGIQRNSTHVWISLAYPYPEIAWFQTLSQTMGSIVDRDMAIDYNAWNGTWTNATGYPVWKAWRRYPNTSYTPLDKSGSDPYGRPANPYVELGGPVMCGTGPYKFTSWDKTAQTWRVDKFDNYWRGWAPDAAHPFHVNTIVWGQQALYPTQDYPGNYDDQILSLPSDYSLPPTWVAISNLPRPVHNGMFFVSPVALDSPYLPTVGGSPTPSVFSWDENGKHMRKTFAYALNRTHLLTQIWKDEAYVDIATWHIRGLTPNYTNPAVTIYDINVTAVKEELLAAQFTIGNMTKSAWEWGFNIPLVYVTTSASRDVRRDTHALIKSVIEPLSGTTYKGKVAGTFTLPNIGVGWIPYLDAMETMMMPTFQIGWLADFLDVDNYARPFMHSQGDFTFFQGYGADPDAPYTDNLIDVGVKTPDGLARQAIYYELQQIYHDKAMGVPTGQPLGKAIMRNWVRGWYYNMLYPGVYGYDRWKGFTSDVNRDGMVDIFDLVEIAIRFGQTVPPAPENVDIVKDGVIDIFDLAEAATQFGSGGT